MTRDTVVARERQYGRSGRNVAEVEGGRGKGPDVGVSGTRSSWQLRSGIERAPRGKNGSYGLRGESILKGWTLDERPSWSALLRFRVEVSDSEEWNVKSDRRG